MSVPGEGDGVVVVQDVDDVELPDPEVDAAAAEAGAAAKAKAADDEAAAAAAAAERAKTSDDRVSDVLKAHEMLTALVGDEAAGHLLDLPPAALKAVLKGLGVSRTTAEASGKSAVATEVLEERKVRATQDDALGGDAHWASLQKLAEDGKAEAEVLPETIAKGVRAMMARQLMETLEPVRKSTLSARQDASVARMLQEHPEMKESAFAGDVASFTKANPGVSLDIAIKFVNGQRAAAELKQVRQANQFRDAGRADTWALSGGGSAAGGYVPLPTIPEGGFDTSDDDAMMRLAVGTLQASDADMEGLRARVRAKGLESIRFGG